jgi:RNA polymerase sigma-70 factor (sigma-E family)
MNTVEEAAYREYVTARMHSLRRTAYLLCHDWHTADDLVSITLGKLYRHWGRSQQVEHLDAYVHRILLNSWLDERRRPWRRETPTDDLPDESVAPAPVDEGDRQGVLELLRQLPGRKRAIVVLRYYCDLSVEETADILGCATGTVRSQSTRALQTLRALVGEIPTSPMGERP